MRLAASIPRGLPHGPFWPGLAATQWGLSVSRDWEDGSGDFKPLWSTRTAKEEKPTNSKTRTQESLPGRNLQYPLGLKGFGSKKSPAKTEVEGFAAWLACIMHRSLFAFLPVLGLLTVTFGGCKEVPRYPWPMAAAGLIRNRCHWQKFFFFFFWREHTRPSLEWKGENLHQTNEANSQWWEFEWPGCSLVHPVPGLPFFPEKSLESQSVIKEKKKPWSRQKQRKWCYD